MATTSPPQSQAERVDRLFLQWLATERQAEADRLYGAHVHPAFVDRLTADARWKMPHLRPEDVQDAIQEAMTQCWRDVARRRGAVFERFLPLTDRLVPAQKAGDLHPRYLLAWKGSLKRHHSDVLGFHSSYTSDGGTLRTQALGINGAIPGLWGDGIALSRNLVETWDSEGERVLRDQAMSVLQDLRDQVTARRTSRTSNLERLAQLAVRRAAELANDPGSACNAVISQRDCLELIGEILDCLPEVRILLPGYLHTVFRSRLFDLLRSSEYSAKFERCEAAFVEPAPQQVEQDAVSTGDPASAIAGSVMSPREADDDEVSPSRMGSVGAEDVDQLPADSSSDPAHNRELQELFGLLEEALLEPVRLAEAALSAVMSRKQRSEKQIDEARQKLDRTRINHRNDSEVFLLHRLEGLSEEQIGLRLGLTRNQVRTCKGRAFKRIVNCLRNHGVPVPADALAESEVEVADLEFDKIADKPSAIDAERRKEQT